MATTNTPPKAGKRKGAAVPNKRTMNFVHHKSSFNPVKVFAVILVLALAFAVFAKFGILDQLEKKQQAYNQLAAKQEALAMVNSRLVGYEELADQYGRYSYGWMNDNEVNMVSRMDVMDLVETYIANIAVVENIAVNNNVLSLNFHGITLAQASDMVDALEDDALVVSATLYSAVASEAKEASFSISIILEKEAE